MLFFNLCKNNQNCERNEYYLKKYTNKNETYPSHFLLFPNFEAIRLKSTGKEI